LRCSRGSEDGSRDLQVLMHKSGWLRLPLIGTFLFLYTPILVLVFLSFNRSDSAFSWGGFSTKWYQGLLSNSKVLEGLGNTLMVAFSATFFATILGTLLAVGLHRHSRSTFLQAFSLAPAIVPDLVLGIGLLVFYSIIQMSLGLHSVLIAHIVFGSAFVTAVVRARLDHTDPSLEEAARDLGASATTTFARITIPSLIPAIISGALLVFTLSLDEFVVAFFTAGPASPTLPIVVYSMVRFGVTPEINALASVLLLVSFTLILAAQRITKLTDAV